MRRTLSGLLLTLLTLASAAQTQPAPHQEQFRAAVQAYQSKNYDAALLQFKQLIAGEPTNIVYKKYAAESAINAGDTPFALATLLPLAATSPDDWQTHCLLARAYAQTAAEPGHKQQRDDEIATVIRLHNTNPDAQIGKLRDFLLETVHQGDQTVEFHPALTPWGPYKVELIARTFDASNKPGLRLTLESSDLDQTLFAQQHPKEAAAGQRSYTLDGYAPEQKSADGHTIQTHFTYAFFVGKPTYDDLRERILAVTSGKLKALSSRSGPID